MRGADMRTLQFDFDFDKTEIAIRKAIWEAREATTVPLPSFSDLSSNEEMGEPKRIALGDCRRLDNIDEVTQGFQPWTVSSLTSNT